MADPHVLDRAVWSSLGGRQSDLALTRGRAIRFAPDYGLFAATPDDSDESLADLAALIAAHGDVGVFGLDEPRAPPGTAATLRGAVVQMVAAGPVDPPATSFRFTDLADADAAEMLALARLTEPGPFFARTHQLGPFVGVKQDDRLVAMAGERMRPDGFTEVSAVCTHPDHRGHGYAAALSRIVAARIQARGDTPFLHAYESNTAAISVYRGLGFSLRQQLAVALLSIPKA
jgi:predicted GNAT family acetyltransferase